MRTNTGRFGLTNSRHGKKLNNFLALASSGPASPRVMGLLWGISELPCPEVVEERKRMAREIHDTLAQQFAGILLHLEAANNLHDAAQQHISECVSRAKELAKSGLEDARRMLLGLRPKLLEGAQLCDALKRLTENFARDCGIESLFCVHGRAYKLSESVENELYRVAQEALCNVRKHSRASSVFILLTYRPGDVRLAIRDNGQGFEAKRPQAGAHGFGMLAMSERALRLGGRVDVNSHAGAGTELQMTIPVNKTISTERSNQ